MNELVFDVPRHVRFSELHLRTEEGVVLFEWAPLAEICTASGIQEEDVALGCGSVVPLLLHGWLHEALPGELAHRQRREARRLIDAMLAPHMRRATITLAKVRVRRVGPMPLVH